MIEDGNKEFSPKDIKNKIIPDLMIYAVWLAEEFGVNVEHAYLKILIENIKRLYADKIPLNEIIELEKCINDKLKTN